MKQTPLNLIIDTDAGVDDAIAITWLISQSCYPINIVGFSSVAGNATEEDVTNNLLTLMEVLGRKDIPLVRGCRKPLYRPHSRIGGLIHGPDGMWMAAEKYRQKINNISSDIIRFYKDITEKNANVSLLALGPVTNLAFILERDPGLLHSFRNIIMVGGCKYVSGSRTPVTTFNFWQDPEAAQEILEAGLPVTIILKDAHSNLIFDYKDIEVFKTGNAALKFIAGPLYSYACAQTQSQEPVRFQIPDLSAAMIAADASLCKKESALVKIITETVLARGMAVIGMDTNEQISMIVSDMELNRLVDNMKNDSGFKLEKWLNKVMEEKPHNIDVVLKIDALKMRELFFKALLR